MVASELEALLWGGLSALLGVAAVWYGVSELRDWWALRGADPAALHEATGGGPVQLEGEARPVEAPTTAPVTGRDAVGYDVTVREVQPDDDFSERRTIHEETVVEPFLLSAADGTAYVVADDADFELDVGDDEDTVEVDADAEPPERVREFDADRGLTDGPPGEGFLSWGDRAYEEAVLSPGETAFVSGVARPPSGTERAVPRSASLVVFGADGDLPGDLPSVVADAPMSGAARRELKRGLGGLVLAAFFLGGATLFFL